MTGWGAGIDGLARATARLLTTGPAQTEPLRNATTAVAARDMVVAEVAALVHSVTGASGVDRTAHIDADDVATRPGWAFSTALDQLPPALPAGLTAATGPGVPLPADATPVEALWRDALRASVTLEPYVDALSRLPDDTAWAVLRDLTTTVAAMPYLDGDLADRLPAGDPSIPSLTSRAEHDRLRVTADALLGRIDGHLAGQHPAVPTTVSTALPPRPQPPARQIRDLRRSGQHLTATVEHLGADLSFNDVRYCTRLLNGGLTRVAGLLDRPTLILGDCRTAAAALRTAARAADALRRVNAETLTPPNVQIPAAVRALDAQLQRLARLGQELPAGAPAEQWARLLEPALGWAFTATELGAALHNSLSAAVRSGTVYRQQERGYNWVRIDPAANPAVLTAAAVARTALGDAALPIQAAYEALARPPRTCAPSERVRKEAGQARAQLRAALLDRARLTQPATLTALTRQPRVEPHHLAPPPTR